MTKKNWFLIFWLPIILLMTDLKTTAVSEAMLDSTSKQKATTFLNKLVQDGKTPGFQYILVSTDQVVYEHFGGYANVANKVTVTENTTFNAFSVTKTFTALAILQLAEQGRLNLEENISKYLEYYPYSKEVTIRQVLSHTAGLPNPIPLSWIHLQQDQSQFDSNRFLREVLEKNNQLSTDPGTKFAYSNIGYLLLGQVIENKSGISYQQYLKENILQRLEIHETEIDFIIPNQQRHAKGYQDRFSLMNLLLGFFINKSKYTDQNEGKWLSFKSFYTNGVSYGGLIGNGRSFAKYLQELLKPDSGLLSEKYKTQLFTEQLTRNNQLTGMCLSWFTGRLNGQRYFAHAGGGGGYYCEIRLYPDLGMASVIMFNRSGMNDERFLDRVDQFFIN